MDRAEDEPAVPAEDLAALQDLGPDRLGGPEGQGLLGVDAAPGRGGPAALLLPVVEGLVVDRPEFPDPSLTPLGPF